MAIEHPTGAVEGIPDIGPDCHVRGAGTIRTARKLFKVRFLPR